SFHAVRLRLLHWREHEPRGYGRPLQLSRGRCHPLLHPLEGRTQGDQDLDVSRLCSDTHSRCCKLRHFLLLSAFTSHISTSSS
ncbi:hypothetical protein IE81DRAFT_366206, partial [Ceraceosorus guamensis]